MNKLKETFKDKTLYVFVLITLTFFGIFVLMQFAPDTYFGFAATTKEVVRQFFSCGRFVTGIAVILVKGIFKLHPTHIYNLSYYAAIICTIISLYRLYKLINKDISNKIVCAVLSILVIINIFSFELFVYIEKGVMMFAVLMSILAVEQARKFLEDKKWQNAIIAVIYMLIGTCSYQGAVGIFVAISLVYIIKYSKNIKEFLLNNIKVALIYGIPAVINFVMVSFMSYNARVGGKIVLSESIVKIVSGVKNMIIGTYNLFPKYAFILAILAIILFAIYKLISKKEERIGVKVSKGIGVIYILLGTLFATVAPQILQNTDSIWFVARSSYPMASIIGILLIYIFSNFEVKELEKNIIIVFSVIYMLVQILFFVRFAIDGYIVNYEDKQQAITIINMINKYEEENDKKITQIAVYQDKYIQYTYPEIKSYGDLNIRAFCKDWVIKEIMNFYSGRQLQIVEKNNELRQHFEQRDWGEFNQEQIIFENDTMHICIY